LPPRRRTDFNPFSCRTTTDIEFFGDFKADILVGSKHEKEFCVIEFENGRQDTIFKKQRKRKNPEWSARFEHAFSQIVDWFYNLEDFKNTQGFSATFGPGHTSFTELMVTGLFGGCGRRG
jgi:Domain of unknown function (DUF4263)